MIADYIKNANLFERCITFIDKIFPGAKKFALKGVKYGASWKEASIPFIVEEHGEIIAHAGVIPITVMLNGKLHQSAAIHAVGVSPKYRGKGYFKQLMQEVMDYVEKNFELSILFTSKPYLYKNYPYQIMLPEYDFVLKNEKKISLGLSDLRALNLDNANDLALLHQLLSNRLPLSNQLSIQGKNANASFIFNTMHNKVYYSKKLDILISYQVIDDTLYIKEIVTQKQQSLPEIIALITEPFNKVVLQFCPDKFLNEDEYDAVLAKPENCVMVSPKFKFNGKYFRYPEIYGF